MMNKKIVIVIAALLSFLSVFAQESADTSYWKKGGVASLNASQVSFTNWAAGGENSLSGSSFFNLFANYKKDRTTWDNTLDLGYGMMKMGFGEESLYFKTDDKMDFSSKYGQYAFEHWYYSALLGFKSQFAEGYKKASDTIRISNLLAPAYLTISLGMDYKPNDNFSVLLSPFTGKTTFVNDTMLSNAGAFGVLPGELVRFEFGGYIKAQLKLNIMENISLVSKLDLFSNYLESPQNIDVNFENLITFKINDFFAANLHLTMLYDDDIKMQIDRDGDGITEGPGSRLQIKQLFGVGITYKI